MVDDVLTLEEVAEMLKLNPQTVYRQARAGKLPAQMECPKCGYMMDAFTVECPRCARYAAPYDTKPKRQPVKDVASQKAQFRCQQCGIQLPEGALDCPACSSLAKNYNITLSDTAKKNQRITQPIQVNRQPNSGDIIDRRISLGFKGWIDKWVNMPEHEYREVMRKNRELTKRNAKWCAGISSANSSLCRGYSAGRLRPACSSRLSCFQFCEANLFAFL